MNSIKTEFHQLGRFIYEFQIVERQIEDIIILLASSDDEMIYILINELGFYQKIKATDVMFSRFIDTRTIDSSEKKEFHNIIDKIIRLCERRNELVHSKYMSLLKENGEIGFLRNNSKLKPSKGIREEIEEVLMPEDFTSDLKNIGVITNALETYRLKIINWLYPDETA